MQATPSLSGRLRLFDHQIEILGRIRGGRRRVGRRWRGGRQIDREMLVEQRHAARQRLGRNVLQQRPDDGALRKRHLGVGRGREQLAATVRHRDQADAAEPEQLDGVAARQQRGAGSRPSCDPHMFATGGGGWAVCLRRPKTVYAGGWRLWRPANALDQLRPLRRVNWTSSPRTRQPRRHEDGPHPGTGCLHRQVFERTGAVAERYRCARPPCRAG